jgi:hypothetical protein
MASGSSNNKDIESNQSGPKLVLFDRTTSSDNKNKDEDIWDDRALIKAYNRSIKLIKKKMAKDENKNKNKNKILFESSESSCTGEEEGEYDDDDNATTGTSMENDEEDTFDDDLSGSVAEDDETETETEIEINTQTLTQSQLITEETDETKSDSSKNVDETTATPTNTNIQVHDGLIGTMSELSSYFKRIDWKVGDLCNAIFTNDNRIYPAIITKIFKDDETSCIIKYLYYDNEEIKKLSELMEYIEPKMIDSKKTSK